MSMNIARVLVDVVSLHPLVRIQTKQMLEDVIDKAAHQFPISFPDNTDAKIYLYVVSNNEVLFEECLHVTLEGASSIDRRVSFQAFLKDKKISWKKSIKELRIHLGSHVHLVMQGIAYKQDFYNDPWQIPYAFSERTHIGLKPFRGTSDAFNCINLSPEVDDVQNIVHENLTTLGLPEDRIPNLKEILHEREAM